MQHKNFDATFDVTALIDKTYPVYTTGHRWLKSFTMKKIISRMQNSCESLSFRTFGETETFIWKVFGSAIKNKSRVFFGWGRFGFGNGRLDILGEQKKPKWLQKLPNWESEYLLYDRFGYFNVWPEGDLDLFRWDKRQLLTFFGKLPIFYFFWGNFLKIPWAL